MPGAVILHELSVRLRFLQQASFQSDPKYHGWVTSYSVIFSVPQALRFCCLGPVALQCGLLLPVTLIATLL